MFQGQALSEKGSLFLHTISLQIKIEIFQNLPTSTQGSPSVTMEVRKYGGLGWPGYFLSC